MALSLVSSLIALTSLYARTLHESSNPSAACTAGTPDGSGASLLLDEQRSMRREESPAIDVVEAFRQLRQVLAQREAGTVDRFLVAGLDGPAQRKELAGLDGVLHQV